MRNTGAPSVLSLYPNLLQKSENLLDETLRNRGINRAQFSLTFHGVPKSTFDALCVNVLSDTHLQVPPKYWRSGNDRTKEVLVLPTGTSLAKHPGFSTEQKHNIVGHETQVGSAPFWCAFGALVLNNYSTDFSGTLINITWNEVIHVQFPHNFLQNDDVNTPCINMHTDAPLIQSNTERRHFSSSETLVYNDKDWFTFKARFGSSNRTTGNLTAIFPANLLELSKFNCHSLKHTAGQIANIMPYSQTHDRLYSI